MKNTQRKCKRISIFTPISLWFIIRIILTIVLFSSRLNSGISYSRISFDNIVKKWTLRPLFYWIRGTARLPRSSFINEPPRREVRKTRPLWRFRHSLLGISRERGQILLMLISPKCYTLIWGVLRWIIRTCVLFNRVTATVMDAIIIYFPFFFFIRATFITVHLALTIDYGNIAERSEISYFFLTRRSYVSNFSWCT